MANNRNAVRAGMFMLVSIAVAIAITIAIAGGVDFWLRPVTYTVRFKLTDNLNGLRAGDDVRLGGWRVGTVSHIELDRKHNQGEGNPPSDAMVVAFTLPSKYVLGTDARLAIQSSLTGVTSLNISDLGSDKPLGEGGELVGAPDGLTSLMANLSDAWPKVKEILPKVSAGVDSFHGAMESARTALNTGDSALHTYKDLGEEIKTDWPHIKDRALDRYDTVMASAKGMLETIRDFFGGSTGDFHQTLANAKDISGTVKDRLPPLATSLQMSIDKVNGILAKLQGSMDQVKAVITNTAGLTATAKAFLERNQGHLDEIVTNVNKTIANANIFVADLKTNPWRLVWRPTGDLASNLNVYEAARDFAEGANSLDDASLVLRDALKDPHADPAQIQKLYDNLQVQFAKFRQTEDDLWKKVKE